MRRVVAVVVAVAAAVVVVVVVGVDGSSQCMYIALHI